MPRRPDDGDEEYHPHRDRRDRRGRRRPTPAQLRARRLQTATRDNERRRRRYREIAHAVRRRGGGHTRATLFHNIARKHTIETFDEKNFMMLTPNGTWELRPEHSSYVGKMDKRCPHCAALYFELETENGKYTKCCSLGKIESAMQPLDAPTPLFAKCLDATTKEGKLFLANPITFNNQLSFASFNCEKRPQDTGWSAMTIQGKPMVFRGGVHAQPGKQAFLSHYFFDHGQDVTNAYSLTSRQTKLLKLLRQEMLDHNPFLQSIQMNEDRYGRYMKQLPIWNITFSNIKPPDSIRHKGVYEVPTTGTEIGVILHTAADVADSHRTLTVSYWNDKLKLIQSDNEFYDPFRYALFYMKGGSGWHRDLVDSNMKKLTPLDFYSYMIHARDSLTNRNIETMSDIILNSGKLFLEYACDMYLKEEEVKLNYIRSPEGQKKIKAEVYQGLFDAVKAGKTKNIGRNVILPSTIPGSPRSFVQSYQDCMHIAAEKGKITYFVTMTANQNWPEILSCLQPGQQPWQRPDIIARVFNMKRDMLLKDLRERYVLGKANAVMEVMEFQKRGLPHVHILVIIDEEDVPRTMMEVDKAIWAEIPDPVNSHLYEVATKSMLHNPCGDYNPEAPCMKGGAHCSKHFPMDFQAVTSRPENQLYPLYRRRSPNDGGRSFLIFRGGKEIEVNNSWIASYNPYLTLKYSCHINVQLCHSMKSIKYLFKYVYKGPDRVAFRTDPEDEEYIDEVTKFQDGRCVISSEATARLLSMKMHRRSPAVYRLPVHLKGQHNVFFKPTLEKKALKNNKLSMLTAFFELVKREFHHPLSEESRTDSKGVVHPAATEILYKDLPLHFAFNKRTKKWTRRIRVLKHSTVGRIYYAAPNEGERYFLRLLLSKVPGPRSYRHLRTVNGHVYTTFQRASLARGLLQNDSHWKDLFSELSNVATATQMRNTFASVLILEKPEDPQTIWNQFIDSFSDDFTYRRNRRLAAAHVPLNYDCTPADKNNALADMHRILKQMTNGKESLETVGLPPINMEIPFDNLDPTEKPFNLDKARNTVRQNITSFNKDQLRLWKKFKLATLRRMRKGKIFYVDGPGGTGKSYLLNTFILWLKIHKIKFFTSASSAIAATVLCEANTNHSTYDIPFECFEDSTSTMRMNSQQAKQIRQAPVLVIDEAPNMSLFHLNVIERLLQDLMKNNLPMGGKVIIFAGDWRQTLPIVKKGSRGEVLYRLIKRVKWWSRVEQHKLTINERVRRAGGSKKFAQFVLDVGSGTATTYDTELGTDRIQPPNMIEIPPEIVFKSQDPKDLLHTVYPLLEQEHIHSSTACILTLKNEDVDNLNNFAINLKPGKEHMYYSADSTMDTHLFITPEYMHGLTPDGFPPHALRIKKGTPVILIRNVNKRLKLLNGTRLIVLNCGRRYLKCRIVDGDRTGQIVFITRITFKTKNDVGIGFEMIRIQFPIRLNYCMTISKSQGQTFQKLGIWLPQPVFSHGQLYVALSRCGDHNNIHVLVNDIEGVQGRFENLENRVFTPNIVWYEVL